MLTADDLAEYQAWVEIDGPWWGEREAALTRTLCSVTAAAAGSHIPADEFKVEWTVGEADGAPPLNLLPAADGLRIWAARNGAEITPEDDP